MGKLFRDAFERHEGCADDASFAEVVEAFLSEAELDDDYVIPMNVSKGKDQAEPMLIKIGPEEYAACVVSDAKYVKNFEGQTFAFVRAREFLNFVKKNEFLRGIALNPFTEDYCFLPRFELFQRLEENGIELGDRRLS